MSITAYLNGEFMPLEEAKISPMDRGFIMGDSVYEVIPVYHFSHPFHLHQHLDRLEENLAAVRISLDMTRADWELLIETLLEKNQNQGPNQRIYLQITRGVSMLRSHGFPEPTPSPTIFGYSRGISYHSPATMNQGFTAITAKDTRWDHCNIKTNSLVANELLFQQAKSAGGADAILIRDGWVTEGSSSNVFIVKNDAIITPPLSQHVLGGITREIVIELAQTHGLTIKQQPISEADLRNADEIWITSSTRPIYAIIELDGQPVGNGKPGPLWRSMIDIYSTYQSKLVGDKV